MVLRTLPRKAPRWPTESLPAYSLSRNLCCVVLCVSHLLVDKVSVLFDLQWMAGAGAVLQGRLDGAMQAGDGAGALRQCQVNDRRELLGVEKVDDAGGAVIVLHLVLHNTRHVVLKEALEDTQVLGHARVALAATWCHANGGGCC